MLRASPRAPRSSLPTPRPAFTLVELLVVIGIIALLISILLPALNRARGSANQTACAANLRTVGQAVGIYVVNNKGSLPFGYTRYYGPNGAEDYTNYAMLLLNTLDSRISPLASQQFGGSLSGNVSKTRNAFICPEVPGGVDPVDIGVVHYRTNPRLLPNIDAEENATTVADKRRGYKASKVKRSAEVAMLFDGSLTPSTTNPDVFKPQYSNPVADALDQYAMTYGAYFYFDPAGSNPSTFTSGLQLNITPITISGTAGPLEKFNTDTEENTQNVRFRHMKNTSMNLLYVDGHVGTATHKVKSTGQFTTGGTDLKRETFYVNRQ